MRIRKHVFYQTITTVRIGIRQTIKEAIALWIFDHVIQVAFFFVAKRFTVADEKLKVARVWFVDVWVINLVDNSVTEREPNAATGVIRCADPFLCARSPARFDSRRAKRHWILRWVHLENLAGDCAGMFAGAGARPPTYNWIKPRRVALATASVRLMTFILAKMAFTCDFTVPSLMNNAEPISLLLFPWAISLSTSISRALKVSPLTRSASLAARCTGTQVSPACTRRMQSISASRGTSLSR